MGDLREEQARRRLRTENLRFPKLRTAAQGLTLGFADEIEAGLRNPGLLWGSDKSRQEYERDVANARGAVSGYRESYPGRSASLEMGGAVLPLVGAGLMTYLSGGTAAPATSSVAGTTMSRVPGLLKSMGKAAGWGAAEGTAYGVGTQEGNLSQRDFLNSEGAMGAGIGFMTPPALRTGAAVIRHGRNPMTSAERSLEGLLRNDGVSVGEMLASRNLDKPQVLADLAGENSQRRLAALEGMPGPQRGVIAGNLSDRQAGQAERVIGDLEETTDIALRDTDAYALELMAQRRAQAAPAYKLAYEAGENINDPVIKRLMAQGDMEGAYNRGKRLYDLERTAAMADGLEPMPEIPAWPDNLGDLTGDALDEAMKDFNPSLRQLDVIYRGLRDQGSDFGSNSPDARNAYKSLADSFRNRLDETVPEYADARRIYKSDSEMIDALAAGRTFMSGGKVNERTIRREIEALGDAEQEMYRLGAIDNVRMEINRAAKDGTNIESRFFGTKDKRDRLRYLFPDTAKGTDDYNALLNRLAQESKMQETLRATQGSRTTPIGEEVKVQKAEESFLPDDSFMQSFSRNPTTTIADRTLGAGLRGLRTGGGLPRNRAELAGLLTDPVGQRMPNTSVSSEFIPGQSPILSPKMRQFYENMNRRNERARTQTGLLDRYSGQLGGAAGLLGVIGSQ